MSCKSGRPHRAHQPGHLKIRKKSFLFSLTVQLGWVCAADSCNWLQGVEPGSMCILSCFLTFIRADIWSFSSDLSHHLVSKLLQPTDPPHTGCLWRLRRSAVRGCPRKSAGFFFNAQTRPSGTNIDATVSRRDRTFPSFRHPTSTWTEALYLRPRDFLHCSAA